MENIYVKLSPAFQIGTERLILRPVTLDDTSHVWKYASDEENVRYTFATNKNQKPAIILPCLLANLWGAGALS